MVPNNRRGCSKTGGELFSILHISDLHRSPDDPISNDALISSLVADRDHYMTEDPAVPAPEAIVVSGDLIQGASLGDPDPEAEIERQYETALAFLEELADRFVSGEKSRIVIVPGNHDIDWNAGLKGLTEVPPEDVPPNLWSELVRPDALLRWDWRTQRVFKVVDLKAYEGRLSAYRNFFDRFYGSASKDQSPEEYFTLHELLDGRIGVAAFNSCFGNDCFSLQGAIPEKALARAHLALHDQGKGYELLMAVWHHSVEGPPLRSDYLDIDAVDRLIGTGFRLGLHGHQHRAEATARSINQLGGESMAVISAGSLCAGGKELPPGVNRQYNVIELGDDLCSAEVHVRELAASIVFGPARLHAFGGTSHFRMAWTAPPPMHQGGPNAAQRRIAELILTAEEELGNGKPEEAAAILEPARSGLPAHGRRLLVKAVEEIGNPQRTPELIGEPAEVAELVLLVDAYTDTKNFDEARQCLDNHAERLAVPATLRDELLRRIDAEEMIAHGA
jgi:hypothetical protein